jgi:hypothetical protein
VGRVGIEVRDQTGTSYSDSLGWYLRFGLPAGRRELRFFCPTRRRWQGRLIARRMVPVTATTDSVVDFLLPLTGCAEPPVTSRQVEMRGHYISGFETSDFDPCEPLPDLIGTAYEGLPRRVWVTLAEGVSRPAGGWPDRGRE